ncbi:uncharacterized protein LOC131151177 [Malania oleifera]|uniref:uncharacterized protein LOC131151177 n=1 Tax=Malania oleifera TaxID=397392 RepID=UPI0025AE30EB|nr:uncharacterized protein LOC131151177 [Malania oleifera]
MQLKEEITLIQRESHSVSEYLHAIKVLVDELAVIDSPVSADDTTLYLLNDSGPEFSEIASPIRAHENSFMFKELYDMLVGHKSYLQCVDASNSMLVATTNPTQRRIPLPLSTATNVPALVPMVNVAPTLVAIIVGSSLWLVDSTASHNIISDLANLSVHSEYDDTDEVIIGDDSVSSAITKDLAIPVVPSIGQIPSSPTTVTDSAPATPSFPSCSSSLSPAPSLPEVATSSTIPASLT